MDYNYNALPRSPRTLGPGPTHPATALLVVVTIPVAAAVLAIAAVSDAATAVASDVSERAPPPSRATGRRAR